MNKQKLRWFSFDLIGPDGRWHPSAIFFVQCVVNHGSIFEFDGAIFIRGGQSVLPPMFRHGFFRLALKRFAIVILINPRK